MSLRSTLETRKAQPTMEGPAYICTGPLDFRTPANWIRSCCLMIFATTCPPITCRGFRGIGIAVLKPSPLCCRKPWSMVTVWATLGPQRRRCRGDDRRLGHHAPRDANGKCQGPDARLSTLGQFTRSAENDRAAISGRLGQRYPPCER